MSVTITWIGHASFKIQAAQSIVYIDPWKIDQRLTDGNIVLISHSHYDHYSAEDIELVSGKDCQLIAPQDVITKNRTGTVIEAGQTIQTGEVTITAVPAYNVSKNFHPKENNWIGFIIELDNKKIYYAGDTDATDEMISLDNIDLAMLPVGGTYTLDAREAALAVNQLKPKIAVPYHWGDIVGKRRNADEFAEMAECQTVVLLPGESIQI